MTTKIMDVKQPVDAWERGYARLEYWRTEFNQLFAKRITIKQPINVVDISEEIEAEIAIGKDYIKGTWCASAHFDYEV